VTCGIHAIFSKPVSGPRLERLEKHSKRKEEITMKYEKPELTVLPSATEAIQAKKSGSTSDSICNPPESGRTDCGYQSDE
jgi:hypothetical protein